MDAASTVFRTDRFELRPAQRQLLVGGSPAKVGARAFDLLLALMERRDRHVAKAELLQAVWPGLVVEENNLEVHVWALRRLIGPDVIVTIPGRGYRFGLTLTGPLPPPLAVAPSRSPAPPLTRLIGRDDELAALRELLRTQRLVTVAGGGGFGKTLLVQHLLHAEREARPEGTAWVDLAALAGAAPLVATVAVSLGLPPAQAAGVSALADALASRRLLLALDDCDARAAEVATFVRSLLEQAPALVIVLTAQRSLRIEGEQVFRIGALALPPPGASVEAALEHGAVALFVERARALDQRFVLDAQNLDAVVSICRHLDGHALAIELAAARVPLMGAQRLAASLDQRLELLTQGQRGAPARHHSLRAMLAWSHQLLAPVEQCVFRRLALFRGGVSLELAQATAADGTLDEWQVLDALDALVDRSLVTVSSHDPPRYRLLESAQVLAQECLSASGESQHVERRFAQAVCARLVSLSDASREGRLEGADLMTQIAPDLDNARAAMAWALRHDALLAVTLATPLSNGLGWNHYDEGLQMFEASAALLDEARQPAPIRLRWMIGAAAYLNLMWPERALPWARKAAELARAIGDRQRLARALGVIASAPAAAAAPEEQAAAVAEMCALDQAGWPPVIRLQIADAESRYATRLGDLTRAEAALRRHIELAHPATHAVSRATALTNLANLLLQRGDAAGAAELARQLEQQWRSSPDQRRLALARLALCLALLVAGDAAQARAAAERGWPTAASCQLQAMWLPLLAELSVQEGRPAAAARLLGRSAAHWARRGDAPGPGTAAAVARAGAAARAALGAARFELQFDLGRALSDEDAAQLAFAAADPV